MPNDCDNYLTITSEFPDELTQLIQNEFQYKSNESDEYLFRQTVKIQKRGCRGIQLRVWSAWQPDFEWLEGLLDKYPTAWIKNDWIEEGGFAGIWIGTRTDGEKNIRHFEWVDLCIEAKHYLFTQ